MKDDIARLAALVRSSAPAAGRTRIVAIDGCAGAGKSTLARRLADGLGGAPIVAIDDFASWDNQFDWWPRLLAQVILPLAQGKAARYQRFDWDKRELAEWIDLAPAPETVIIEGVSAMRSEFEGHLAYRIWVEAPRALRLRRGLARDGDSMRPQWDRWMAAEDDYVAIDKPIERADVVVSGTS